MINLKFLKWKKTCFLLYLFSISIFSPNVLANPFELNYFVPQGSEDVLWISFIFGMLISTFTYYCQEWERDEIQSSKSLGKILFLDFWFDAFVLIKFTTFLYFLSLTGFYTYIISGLIFYTQTGLSSFIFVPVVTAPLILIFTRIFLEFFIAVIKIAENSGDYKTFFKNNGTTKFSSISSKSLEEYVEWYKNNKDKSASFSNSIIKGKYLIVRDLSGEILEEVPLNIAEMQNENNKSLGKYSNLDDDELLTEYSNLDDDDLLTEYIIFHNKKNDKIADQLRSKKRDDNFLLFTSNDELIKTISIEECIAELTNSQTEE